MGKEERGNMARRRGKRVAREAKGFTCRTPSCWMCMFLATLPCMLKKCVSKEASSSSVKTMAYLDLSFHGWPPSLSSMSLTS